MTWGFQMSSIHYHRSRGCKSVTCQSWRSKKISLYSLFFLVKKGSNGSEVKSFLDLQLWQVTVLHQVYKLSHGISAANIHIFLHPISCIYILLSIYIMLVPVLGLHLKKGNYHPDCVKVIWKLFAIQMIDTYLSWRGWSVTFQQTRLGCTQANIKLHLIWSMSINGLWS